MQAKIPADIWEQVKSLFCAGASTAHIAGKLGLRQGTIEARATRHGWRKQRRTGKIVNACLAGEAPEQVAALAEMVQVHGASRLQREGLGMLEVLAHDARETIGRLRLHRPGTLEEEEQRERTAKNLVQRVKDCCGLTDQASVGLLVVGKISGAASSLQGQRLLEPLQSPAIIDVSTSTPYISPEPSPKEASVDDVSQAVQGVTTP